MLRERGAEATADSAQQLPIAVTLKRIRLMSASIPVAISTVIFVAMCLVFVAQFGMQITRVEGFSMQPTLENRDVVIVNSVAYELDDPQPGDIVTLYYPMDPTRVFIKRDCAGRGGGADHRRTRVCG